MAICRPSSASRRVKRRIPAGAGGAGANDLPGIGAEHLADRNQAEEQAAEDGKQQSQNVSPGIRIDRHIDGDIRESAATC